jgi:hypothetical protein
MCRNNIELSCIDTIDSNMYNIDIVSEKQTDYVIDT